MHDIVLINYVTISYSACMHVYYHSNTVNYYVGTLSYMHQSLPFIPTAINHTVQMSKFIVINS